MAIQRQTKRVQPVTARPFTQTAVTTPAVPSPDPAAPSPDNLQQELLQPLKSIPEVVRTAQPIELMPATALSQPETQGEQVVNKQITLTIPTDAIFKYGQMALIAVLSAVIIYNFIGKSLIDNWKGDDQAQVDPDKDDTQDGTVKPDEVVPVQEDHAAAAAVALYRLHAADWQSKMEILKLSAKQSFPDEPSRAEWINKEFAARFSSSADAFLEHLSHVMDEKMEGRMSDIMSASRVSYDVEKSVAKIDAAAKKLKKK